MAIGLMSWDFIYTDILFMWGAKVQASLCRLAWAYVTQKCDQYKNLMCRWVASLEK